MTARLLFRYFSNPFSEGLYVETHPLGRGTGADGGYKVSGENYIPDVGFISKVRQPQRLNTTWNPLAPDLAVEVVSPTDRPQDIADKVANYLPPGTLLWYVYPDLQQVKVYMPGQAVKTLCLKDVLNGSNILPGFNLPLQDIFPSE